MNIIYELKKKGRRLPIGVLNKARQLINDEISRRKKGKEKGEQYLNE